MPCAICSTWISEPSLCRYCADKLADPAKKLDFLFRTAAVAGYGPITFIFDQKSHLQNLKSISKKTVPVSLAYVSYHIHFIKKVRVFL
jgi:hypothetical protein